MIAVDDLNLKLSLILDIFLSIGNLDFMLS